MKRRGYKHYVRKAHRYLGVFLGIQFLFWTIGGIYFSWTRIDEVRGDSLRAEQHRMLPAKLSAVPPDAAVRSVLQSDANAGIMKIELTELLGELFYELSIHDSNGKARTVLARAGDGSLRPAINETEARSIATAAMKMPLSILAVEFMTAEMIGSDHEYREKPMPAWVVRFEGDVNVYVSAETGRIGAVRNSSWRIFDFLWMLHTLDFKARDDINNWLLRGFSILGLVTISSGFALFFVSSRLFRRRSTTV